jgi:hypothetical protein
MVSQPVEAWNCMEVPIALTIIIVIELTQSEGWAGIVLHWDLGPS